uniref:PUB domain-containing protein n=1 Tax=Chrysotila carterae TaxID=13221 RepID=A0A6S9ZCD6_CHRCT
MLTRRDLAPEAWISAKLGIVNGVLRARLVSGASLPVSSIISHLGPEERLRRLQWLLEAEVEERAELERGGRTQLTQAELRGRQTGSLQWRRERGELGSGGEVANEMELLLEKRASLRPVALVLTNGGSEARLSLSYSAVTGSYSANGSVYAKGLRALAACENAKRYEESDWDKAYIARETTADATCTFILPPLTRHQPPHQPPLQPAQQAAPQPPQADGAASYSVDGDTPGTLQGTCQVHGTATGKHSTADLCRGDASTGCYALRSCVLRVQHVLFSEDACVRWSVSLDGERWAKLPLQRGQDADDSASAAEHDVAALLAAERDVRGGGCSGTAGGKGIGGGGGDGGGGAGAGAFVDGLAFLCGLRVRAELSGGNAIATQLFRQSRKEIKTSLFEVCATLQYVPSRSLTLKRTLPDAQDLNTAVQRLKRHPPSSEVAAATQTVLRVLSNVRDHPSEDKYRTVKLAKLKARIGGVEGALEVLLASGFREEVASGERSLVLAAGASIDELRRAIEMLGRGGDAGDGGDDSDGCGDGGGGGGDACGAVDRAVCSGDGNADGCIGDGGIKARASDAHDATPNHVLVQPVPPSAAPPSPSPSPSPHARESAPTATPPAPAAPPAAAIRLQALFRMLSEGCGDTACQSAHCCSNKAVAPLTPHEAAVRMLALAPDPHARVCPNLSREESDASTR